MKSSRKDSPSFRDAAHRCNFASAFASGARRYNDVRPSYPDEISHFLHGLHTVADVGCGTGKLTEVLKSEGHKLYALDPSPEMTRVFSQRHPEIPVWRATAENTALADSSVDALSCAQTWHWVDTDAACAEADRVIRPGGELLLCWNTLDVRHPWVLRLSRIMHSGDVQREGFYPTVALPWILEEELRTVWLQPMRAGMLFELMATRSYWLRAGEAVREKMVANLRWYLYERLGFTPDQVLPLPYRTDAFVYRRG